MVPGDLLRSNRDSAFVYSSPSNLVGGSNIVAVLRSSSLALAIVMERDSYNVDYVKILSNDGVLGWILLGRAMVIS